MPGILHGGHEELAPLTVVLDVGGKASLVADVARVRAVLVLDHRLKRVVALRQLFFGGGEGETERDKIFIKEKSQ